MSRDYLPRLREYQSFLKRAVKDLSSAAKEESGTQTTLYTGKAAGFEKALEVLVTKFPELKRR